MTLAGHLPASCGSVGSWSNPATSPPLYAVPVNFGPLPVDSCHPARSPLLGMRAASMFRSRDAPGFRASTIGSQAGLRDARDFGKPCA